MRVLVPCLFLLFVLQAGLCAEFRILAFGDSNTWGWIPNGEGKRFSDSERWTGVLQSELGEEDFIVICDGLVARRTNLDGLTAGPVDGLFLNGAKTLPAAIARNAPVDLVVLFLGTNDLQLGAERTAAETAEAVFDLADLIRTAENLLYSNYPAPEVMIVIPPAFGELSNSPLAYLFEVGQRESMKLSAAFESRNTGKNIPLWDSANLPSSSIGSDGIHLSKLGHEALGKSLASFIKKMYFPQ